MKQSMALVLVLALFAAPALSFASDHEQERAMVGDTILARPLGIASVVIGSALFVVSLPFAALGGNVKETAKELVVDPFNYTFQRPVGDFENQPKVVPAVPAEK